MAGGTTIGLFEGKSFKESFYNSLNGIWKSALMGGAFSAASTAAYCIADGINPLNGKEILLRAKDFGITEQEIQHVENVRNGEPGKFRHDGTKYYNNDGLLPENTTYTEYVIPRPGGYSPAGTHRIIVGADGSWYYTPDYYKTFFKFKP